MDAWIQACTDLLDKLVDKQTSGVYNADILCMNRDRYG